LRFLRHFSAAAELPLEDEIATAISMRRYLRVSYAFRFHEGDSSMARLKLPITACLAAIYLLATLQPASAVDSTWVGTTDDINLVDNWGGALPIGGTATFTDVGNHNPVLTADFNTTYLSWAEAVNGPYTLTGPFLLTAGDAVADANGVAANSSDFDVTIDVTQLDLTRTATIVSGDWIISSSDRGTGNLTLGHSGGSMVLRMGMSSGTVDSRPTISAFNSTTVTVYPTVDFSTSITTSGTRDFRLNPSSGSTINLFGGISGTGTDKPSRFVRIIGSGGKVVLGNSGTWDGRLTVGTSDLEINHNDSLGAVGSSASFTEILQTANTGALRLTNNITTGETIYLYERTTTANPQLRNISGSNTITGTILNDRPNTTGFCMLSSDGDAMGDLLTLSGDIRRTSTAGNGLSELWLMGAGDAVVMGNVTQDGSNNAWTEVRKTGIGTWTLSGTANNYTGGTVIEEGVLSLGSVGALTNTSTINVRTNGTLDVSGQTSFTVGGMVSQIVKGDGAVLGDLAIAAGSTFAVDYSGSVIDSLTISGELDISNAAIDFNDVGGALTPGVHVIATYGSLVGTSFLNVIDKPDGFVIDYDYLGNQIALVAPTPGDFNGDGVVDGADFNAWQMNFPTSENAALLQGDADGDGDVDGADFIVWQTNFAPAPAPGTSPVPEPAAFLLFGLGFSAMLALAHCRGMTSRFVFRRSM
jgi:autotransporter-associated beta strand protein